MVIFAGVDGTGEFSNANYQDRFAHSHVNKLSRGEGLSGPQAWIFQPFYHRGPRIIGNDTFIQACKVFYYVATQRHRHRGARVFLSGYSRGGAAAIAAARWLQRVGLAVDALFLFDAVDRSLPVDGYTISRNVKQVYHARRDPAARSRAWFGNCGCRREDPAKTGYEQRYFFATHGGLGGMPWDRESVPAGGSFIDEGPPDGLTAVTPDDDHSGSEQVWAWMLARVRREYASLG